MYVWCPLIWDACVRNYLYTVWNLLKKKKITAFTISDKSFYLGFCMGKSVFYLNIHVLKSELNVDMLE